MAKKDAKGEESNNNKNKDDTIVLKVDLHCEGCATKLVKIIRSSQGVEGVKCEWSASKISVVGEVDPLKLCEKIEQKTHKKVEVISPLPKKDKSDGNAENKSKDKDSKEKDNNKDSEDSNKRSKEWKKPKELPVTTAVLKLHLHCQGCIQKIQKIIAKTKGYKELKIDKQKDLVTVTGSMDMKSLVANLKKHLKKNVEVVPAKIDGEKKDKGDKKDGGSDQNGGAEKGEKKAAAADGGGMQVAYGPGFYGEATQQLHHIQYPYAAVHAPQLFSDENPNACNVM